MFLGLFWDPLYGFHVWLAGVLNIDKNVVKIHNHKDIELFGKDLINITLKASWSVE